MNTYRVELLIDSDLTNEEVESLTFLYLKDQYPKVSVIYVGEA